MSQRIEMEVGVCDRVDATESMEWRSRHGSRAGGSEWGHTYVSDNGVKQAGVYSEAVGQSWEAYVSKCVQGNG